MTSPFSWEAYFFVLCSFSIFSIKAGLKKGERKAPFLPTITPVTFLQLCSPHKIIYDLFWIFLQENLIHCYKFRTLIIRLRSLPLLHRSYQCEISNQGVRTLGTPCSSNLTGLDKVTFSEYLNIQILNSE